MTKTLVSACVAALLFGGGLFALLARDFAPLERRLASAASRLRDLTAAHEAAARNGGVTATDDAGLVERLGIPVHVVEGDDLAMKITRPFDLVVAERVDASGVNPGTVETWYSI
jgi:hypothetical protein